MKFKVNDEIIAIKPCDGNDDLIGITGKIFEIRPEEELSCGVYFERLGINGENYRYCWWCEEDSLSLSKCIKNKQLLFDFEE